jgi:YebC/PmpR family DNA-binding regulatory protein
MAGHSQFANIKHRKGAQDKKRAKLFTKILREIGVAAKTGQPDPEFNPRLRNAIIDARTNNLPKDRIEAAVKKATSGTDNENFDEIRYEGYASGGIALIVEALTDNRNRTAGEVRSIFTKSGGSLGETGSVNFMFDHVGIIQFDGQKISEEEIFESAIEAGADDVECSSEIHLVITSIENFSSTRDKLIEKFGDPISAKIEWKAKELIEISDLEKAQKLLKLVDNLEDCDDVQFVCGNYSFAQEIIDQL